MSTYDERLYPITSVWSSFGHKFISTEGNHEQCLTCGALYELVPTEERHNEGRYCTFNGDDPRPCTHDTSMVHGYPGERDDSDGGTTDHDCNCLLCDS